MKTFSIAARARRLWMPLALVMAAAACAPDASDGGQSDGKTAANAQLLSKYRASCAICHAAGTANAARTGDAERWQAIVGAQPMETLIDRVVGGYKGMPPGGMCRNCTREDIAGLIHYMSSASSRP